MEDSRLHLNVQKSGLKVRITAYEFKIDFIFYFLSKYKIKCHLL
jgi:hypothetical protein